jgi:hypothetical protein
LRDAAQELEAAGLSIVVVGNGKPWQAKKFRDTLALPFPLYVDPSMEAYRVAGLKRGAFKTLGPFNIAATLRALKAGFVQHRTQGDPWQQGGAFVITPAGDVPFAKINEIAADSVMIEELVAAGRRLQSR